jgi:hypothetical protein
MILPGTEIWTAEIGPRDQYKSSVEVFVDLRISLKHSFIKQNRFCYPSKGMFEISIPLTLLASQ